MDTNGGMVTKQLEKSYKLNVFLFDSEDEDSTDILAVDKSNSESIEESLKEFYAKNSVPSPIAEDNDSKELPSISYLQEQPSIKSLNSSTILTSNTRTSPIKAKRGRSKKLARKNKSTKSRKIDNEPSNEPSLDDYLHRIVKCKYSRGDIVWAKLDGYSYWPAMIDDDPDIDMYFWVEDLVPTPTHYHVVFFDAKNRLSRSWCRPPQIKPYGTVKVTISEKHYTLYRNRFRESVKQADEALKMPVEERLKKYCFKQRAKKPGAHLCQD